MVYLITAGLLIVATRLLYTNHEYLCAVDEWQVCEVKYVVDVEEQSKQGVNRGGAAVNNSGAGAE